jgi:hypothetical protein
MKVATAFASLFIAGLLFGCGKSPDEMIANASAEVAAVSIKMTLHDVNAKTENVIFHPMAGDGPNGRSYVCGYVKPSTDLYGQPERFIYYFEMDKAFLFKSFDRGQIEQLTAICNSAPFPTELFTFADGKLSLRAK